MKRSAFAFITSFLVLVSSIFPSIIHADGMMIRPDPYGGRWDQVDETNQQAFINYENGMQKMIISTSFNELNPEGLIWIFPIPADPSKVVIDIVDELPSLNGEDVKLRAKMETNTIREAALLTQLYTIPGILINKFSRPYSYRSSYDGYGIGSMGASKNYLDLEQDVIMHEHIEKEGIITEVLTATNANAFYDYLKEKGLNIEKGEIPVLDGYIGKDYSFVVSWVSSKNKPIINQDNTDTLLRQSLNISLAGYLSNIENYPNLAKYISDLKTKLISNTPSSQNSMWDFYYANTEAQYNSFFNTTDGFKIKQQIVDAIISDPKLLYYTVSLNDSNSNQDVKGVSNTDSLSLMINPGIPAPDIYYPPQRDPKPYTNPNEKNIGVFVTFPTDKIYFPLLPTSVYGSKTIPAEIRVLGHVNPKLYETIRGYTETSYYIDNSFSFSNKLFYSGKSGSVKYTKIDINAPSKYYTDDLWFGYNIPIKVRLQSLIVKYPLLGGLLIFAIVSMISSLMAGLLFFKDLRKKPVKLMTLGLFNFLTLLGVITATMSIKREDKKSSDDMENRINGLKLKGYVGRRRVGVILNIIGIPLLAITGLIIITRFSWYASYAYFGEFLYVGVPFALSLYLIHLARKLLKINPEDIEDFIRIKLAGYNTITFSKGEPNKLKFIIAFTLIFCILISVLPSLLS